MNNIPTAGWKTKCKIPLNANASQAGFEKIITNYKWFKDGTEIGTDVNQIFEFSQDGEHNITLEVTDSAGTKDSDTQTVQIAEIGRPTAKLTLVDVENKPIFSGESNEDGKTWALGVDDDNTPYKSNYVMISATGSYDDCVLTDDNLTFRWDASIYDVDHNNMAPKGVDGIRSCFHNKGELRDQLMYFNGMQIVPIHVIKDDILGWEVDSRVQRKPDGTYTVEGVDLNNTYKYPAVEVVNNWEGWEGWRDEKWEKTYLSMCRATLNYTYLKVTLTVIDNLHDINTTVTKIVETRYTNVVDDQNISIDPNHPNFEQVLNCQEVECIPES